MAFKPNSKDYEACSCDFWHTLRIIIMSFIVINLTELGASQGDFEGYVASEIVYKPLQADSKELIPGVPICLKAHHVSWH